MIKEKSLSVARLILTIAVALLVVVFSVWLANKINPEDKAKNIAAEVVKEIARPIISCPRDFENFESLKEISSVEFVSEKIYKNGLNAYVNDIEITLERTGAASRIACGYVYVVAGVGNRPLEEWENIVLSPGIFGGHLVRNRAISIQEIDGKTEILFPLNEISYRQTKDRNEPVYVADWASLLNVSNRITFTTYVNANNAGAFIDKIIIAYKCWNPETGEETIDCNLEVK